MRSIAIVSMFFAFLMDVSTAHGPGQGAGEGAALSAKLREDLEASIPKYFGANDSALCLYVDAAKGCQDSTVRKQCFNLCKPKTVAGWCGAGENWFVIGSQCFFRVLDVGPSASASIHCGNYVQGLNALAQPKDIKAFSDYLVDNDYGYPWSYWLGGSDRAVEGDWRWSNGSVITAVVNQGENAFADDYDCLTIRPGRSKDGSSLYDWRCNFLQPGAICEHFFHYHTYIQGGYVHAI